MNIAALLDFSAFRGVPRERTRCIMSGVSPGNAVQRKHCGHGDRFAVCIVV